MYFQTGYSRLHFVSQCNVCRRSNDFMFAFSAGCEWFSYRNGLQPVEILILKSANVCPAKGTLGGLSLTGDHVNFGKLNKNYSGNSSRSGTSTSIFTTRCHASAVYAIVMCLSTSLCSTETAKHRIMQTIPDDNPGILVFICQRSRQNSNGVTSNGTMVTFNK